jgi:hypothetical protein
MTPTPSHYDEVICTLADPRDRRARRDKVEGHGWTEDALAFETARRNGRSCEGWACTHVGEQPEFRSVDKWHHVIDLSRHPRDEHSSWYVRADGFRGSRPTFVEALTLIPTKVSP